MPAADAVRCCRLSGVHAHRARRRVVLGPMPAPLTAVLAVVSASIGVAISPGGEERAGDLLRQSDLAMYIAKDNGRARWELFDPKSMSRRRAGPALVLVRAGDGSTIWKRQAPAGVDVHVLGTDPEPSKCAQDRGSKNPSTLEPRRSRGGSGPIKGSTR